MQKIENQTKQVHWELLVALFGLVVAIVVVVMVGHLIHDVFASVEHVITTAQNGSQQ